MDYKELNDNNFFNIKNIDDKVNVLGYLMVMSKNITLDYFKKNNRIETLNEEDICFEDNKIHETMLVSKIKENNSYVFHAGTAINADGKIVTNGGRVLCVTALGDSTKIAQKIAYEEVGKISWDGMHFRHDIGNKALK